MNADQLYLSKLINKEEDYDIKNLEILIKKVEIVKDTMELIVYLESSNLINKELIERINIILSEYFNEFKVLLKITYNISGSNEEKLNFYILIYIYRKLAFGKIQQHL